MPIDIIGKSTLPSADAKSSGRTPTAGDTHTATDRGSNSAPDGSADTVSLTRTATILQQLERILENVPVVDLKHVQGVRDQLERGTYTINPMRVGIKLLNMEFGPGLRAA